MQDYKQYSIKGKLTLLFSIILRAIVFNSPVRFPSLILRVHKDFIGERTWVELLPHSRFRLSFGYKQGKDLDRLFTIRKKYYF